MFNDRHMRANHFRFSNRSTMLNRFVIISFIVMRTIRQSSITSPNQSALLSQLFVDLTRRNRVDRQHVISKATRGITSSQQVHHRPLNSSSITRPSVFPRNPTDASTSRFLRTMVTRRFHHVGKGQQSSRTHPLSQRTSALVDPHVTRSITSVHVTSNIIRGDFDGVFDPRKVTEGRSTINSFAIADDGVGARSGFLLGVTCVCCAA